MLKAPLIALGVAASLVPWSAAAQDPDSLITLSLVPGWDAGEHHVAGLQIDLAPGWKTYWRHPGEGGIAPQIDWAGSDNIASLEIRWPHPEIFEDAGLHSIGYSDTVTLPLVITPADADRAVHVTARAELGVCRDICLPVSVRFGGVLVTGRAPGPRAPVLRRTLAETETTAPRDGMRCRIAPIDDGLRLEAELPVAALGGREFVFVDPGRGDVWVSPAELSRTGSRLTAQVDLVPPDARPFALARDTVRATVLGETGLVEFAGCTAS